MSQFAAGAVTPNALKGGIFKEDGSLDWDAGDYAADAALAIPRGLLGGASDIVNLVGLPFGEQLVDDRFGLMDGSESMLGGFIEGAASFSTGFALGGALGVGSKLSKVSGLTRAVAKAGTYVDDAARVAKFAGNVAKADRYARYGKAISKGGKFIEQGVFNSAFADFVSFDGNEQRLSNLVQSFPMLQNPITEYLAASPDDGEIEGRLKNAIEGLFITGATEGLFNLIRVTRAGAKARSLGLDADRAVAEEYGKIRVEQRELLKAAAPQFNDAQLDMSNLLIDKMGVDRRALVLAGNDVATQVAVAAGADPRNKKGLTDFLEDGKALVALFNKADVSTVLHEMAHVARRQLLDRGVDPAISGVSDMELRMLEEWAGARDGVWSVEADEKYATGVERYILDGNAPPGMERTFRKLTNWMRNIYRDVSVTQVGEQAPKEVRQIMSKLLDQGPGVGPKLGAKVMVRGANEAGTLFQESPNSPEWKAWFGNSQAVDSEGRPQVFYHGTNADVRVFEQGRQTTNTTTFGPVSVSRTGIFVSDNPDFAKQFGSKAMPMYVKAESIADVKDVKQAFVESLDAFNDRETWMTAKYAKEPWQLFDGEVGKKFVAYLKKEGYDAARFEEETTSGNGYVSGTTLVAFDSSQLKDVGNRRPTSSPDIRFQSDRNPDLMLGTFYSKLQRTLTESKQRKMSTQQLKGMLTSAGIKQEELYWTGMEDVLAKDGSVDLDEVMRQIQPVELTEVRRGPGERQDAKWATYSGERLVIPGGRNEREFTIRLSPALAASNPVGKFRGPHWDEDNVLVHVRMNDRTGPNGEKVLFIEEVQSDWHQQGRERGYEGQMKPASEQDVRKAAQLVFGWPGGVDPNDVVDQYGWETLAGVVNDPDAAGNLVVDGGWEQADADRFVRELTAMRKGKGVPDAPFKSSDAWTGLAMKRMVAWAVENGYDGIAWTTGKQQADRYNKMLEDVRSISVSRDSRVYNIDVVRTDGTRHSAGAHDDTALKEILGDSMAAKAISDLNEGKGVSEFEGDSIAIGDGAGYKVHYETIVPNQLKQIGKKFGAKVETLKMGDSDEAKAVEAAAEVTVRHVDQPAGEYDSYYRTNFSKYEPIDTAGYNNSLEMTAMLDTYLRLAKVKDNEGKWVNDKGIPQGIRDFKKWAEGKDLKVSEIRFKDVKRTDGETVDAVAHVVELTRGGQRETWVHRPFLEVPGAGFDWIYSQDPRKNEYVFQVKDMDEAALHLKEMAKEESVDFSYGQASGLGTQPYFAFTQPLKDSVSKNGLPLFQSAPAPEPPFSRTNVAPDLGKPGGDPDAPMNWGNLTDVEQAARAMADARPEIPYRSMTREDFMARATEQANALEGILERSSLDDMRRAIAGGHLTDHDLQQFLEFAEGVRITASRFMSDLYNSARQLNVAGGDDIALARFAALESRTDLLISAAKQNQADIARALNFTGTVINPRYNRNPRVLPMLPTPGQQAATPPAAATPSPAAAVPDPAAAATPSAAPDPAMATPAPAAAAPAEMPDARLLDDPAVSASIAREIIEIAGGPEAIRDRIRRIVEAGTDDPMRALQVARDSRRGNLLIEYWMNSILSGPITHAVNMTANTLTAVYLPLERALGAAIGGDQQTAQEALRQLGYVMSQFRDAFALAKQSFREDQSILDNVGTRDDNLRAISGESMRQGRVTRYVAPAEGSRAEGWLDNIGRVINLPTRMLAAEDEFFKQLNYRAAYRSELMMEAMRRYPQLPGVAAQWTEETFNRTIVDGQQYAQNVVLGRAQRAANAAVAAGEITRGNVPNFVARYMADANNWDPQLGALSRRALEFARYATFQTPLEAGPNSPYLTRFGYHLQRASESVPGLRLIFPFIRTPTNLINFAFRRTIPGMMPNTMELLRANAREAADPRMRADMYGRMAFAAGSTALIGIYAASGQISGNGPKNKEERRALEQAGWQPYSIRVGDTWVSYRRMDPFSTLIGLIADFAESYQYDELRQTDDQLGSGLAAIVMSVSRNVVNKSYLTGLTNVVNALGNPEQFSQTLLNNYAGSMVPFSGAMGQSKVGIANDPVLREVRTMLDAIQNKIPGLAENLPPQRNILGEPIIRPRAGFEGVGQAIDLISPFTHTQVKDDKILQEFALVGHGFAPPRETRGAIDLTAFATPSGQQAYDRWMELHGQVKIGGKTLRQALNKLIADPGYQRLSPIPSEDYDSPRVRRLRSVISMYREAAYRQLLKESPELAEAEGIEQSNRRSLRAGASMSQLQALVR